MKKHFLTGTGLALALSVAACAPPAEEGGEAATEEAVVTAGEEAADDGTMASEAPAEEGAAEGSESTGPDEDGNPIDR